VADFKRVLPGAPVYVYDNNCTDATARLAREAGAIVAAREEDRARASLSLRCFEQVARTFS